jgi:hypothetical protein
MLFFMVTPSFRHRQMRRTNITVPEMTGPHPLRGPIQPKNQAFGKGGPRPRPAGVEPEDARGDIDVKLVERARRESAFIELGYQFLALQRGNAGGPLRVPALR